MSGAAQEVEIVYCGPLPSGTIHPPGGKGYLFIRGQRVRVPAALADELLRHDPDGWDVPTPEENAAANT